MSIVVEPADLEAAVSGRGAPFVITANADRGAKVSHDVVEFAGTDVLVRTGRGTIANVEAGSPLTLLWPGLDGEMSIIADGEAGLDGDRLRVRITGAVRHRLP